MKAAKEFQRALKLRPDFIQAALNLAKTRLSLGQFNKAAQAYLDALRIEPKNRTSTNSLKGLLRSGLVPKAADIYFQLGQIWSDAGLEDEAVLAWRAALEHDPGHKKARQASPSSNDHQMQTGSMRKSP